MTDTTAWRHANPEKAAKWASENRDKMRETSRQHYLKNKDKTKARQKAYAAANREKYLAYQKAWRQNNKEKHLAHVKRYQAAHPWMATNAYLRRMYGISLDDYRTMLAKQGGRCAVCGADKAGRTAEKNFHVDHDHETGRVRGLLCGPCNRAIGLFKESATALRAAAEYIERHGGQTQ